MDDLLKHYTGVERTSRFEDSEKLNGLLQELARHLNSSQRALPFIEPEHPTCCVVGNPRSGTTLLLQWLASLGAFSYPTNILARFAYAPRVGALIQQMLFDPEFDPHGDFADIQSDVNFESDLGKSRGALSCNEFQHFFRNHMPNFDLEWLDAEALEKVDCEAILRGLASIEAAFAKPFSTKASMLQFNIPYMAKRMKTLFWVHIKREPIFNMQSILLARKRYYGDQKVWLSSKPKEYNWLKDLNVHQQIAGQVYFTDQSISDGLKSLPAERAMTIRYESFCKNPKGAYEILRGKYEALGCELPKEYAGVSAFNESNKLRLPTSEIDALKEAYNKFESGLIPE